MKVSLFVDSEATGTPAVRGVEPQTEPSQAVIVVLIPFRVMAVPWLVESLEMVATV